MYLSPGFLDDGPQRAGKYHLVSRLLYLASYLAHNSSLTGSYKKFTKGERPSLIEVYVSTVYEPEDQGTNPDPTTVDLDDLKQISLCLHFFIFAVTVSG